MKIPKIIHQIHTKGIDALTHEEKHARDLLKKNNPDWHYQFYNYQNMLDFIKENYSSRYLNAFLSINPEYGAAQADYFRYLLIYKLGGAYFDVKSYTTIPLSHLILPTDDLLLFEWQGGSSQYQHFGLHTEIKRGKEFQQWNIISSANNPYIYKVVETITQNIEQYSVLKFKYGWKGVLLMTGPIAYTNAIDKIEKKETIRILGSSCKNGIIYRNHDSVQDLDKAHYSYLKSPVILRKGIYKYNDKIILYIFLLRRLIIRIISQSTT